MLRVILFFFFGIILILELSSQNTSRIDTFNIEEEVVISGSRQSVDRFNSIQSISTYEFTQLELYTPRSLPEALIGVTGVWMQKTNHGGGSPFIRGLTGNQTLLLIDGIRLNNSTYRYGPNQYFNTVDIFSLDRVEVVRGSGSVQYGSDALGGAAQLMSKTPQFSDQSSWQFDGSLLGKWMSDEMEKTLRADVNLANETFAFHGGLSLRDFGDLLAGGDLGVQAPSSYDEWAADLKSLIKTGDQQILTLAFQKLRQEEVGRYDQVAQRGYQTYFFDPQERTLAYARYKIETVQPLFKEINLTLSWQNSFEGRRKQKLEDPFISKEQDEIDTWGASLETKSEFNSFWSAVSGIEWYGDKVRSSAQDINAFTNSVVAKRGLYPDGSEANNFAMYSLHRMELDRWVIDGGIRYNVVNIDIQDDEFGAVSISPDAIVANIGMMYKLSDQHRIYGSINSGFRAPNINDLSSFGSFDSGIEVPTKTLDPERSVSYELGYRLKTKTLKGNIAAYYTDLNNLITRIPATYNGSSEFNGEAVFTKDNTAEALIAGFEGDINWAVMKDLSLYSRLTYAYGKDVSKDEPLRRIPPLNGMSGMLYRPLKELRFNAEWLYAQKQERLSGGDIRDHRIPEGGTPGWSVLNLYGTYEIAFAEIRLGVQNLLDEPYRIHGSGVDGYGRSMWLGLKLSI